MFCENCGEKTEGTGKFCTKCGTLLVTEAKKSQQNPNEMEQEKGIILSINRKPVVVFLGVLAIIVLIIGMITRDTNRTKDIPSEIEFSVVGVSQQPEALKDIISDKGADSFRISYTLGEDMYIAVGYGEQPSGGYSIRVNALYETGESVVISTELIEPKENTTKTPTHPYIVVKTKNLPNKSIEFK